jgi:hypothetical protein
MRKLTRSDIDVGLKAGGAICAGRYFSFQFSWNELKFILSGSFWSLSLGLISSNLNLEGCAFIMSARVNK